MTFPSFMLLTKYTTDYKKGISLPHVFFEFIDTFDGLFILATLPAIFDEAFLSHTGWLGSERLSTGMIALSLPFIYKERSLERERRLSLSGKRLASQRVAMQAAAVWARPELSKATGHSRRAFLAAFRTDDVKLVNDEKEKKFQVICTRE